MPESPTFLDPLYDGAPRAAFDHAVLLAKETRASSLSHHRALEDITA